MSCSCRVRLSSGWTGQEQPAHTTLTSLTAHLAPAVHLQEHCTVHWQLPHFLGDPFFHMNTPGLGTLPVEDGNHFLPFPHLPIQTRSRPRFLYTASGMVLHFLGSVVLWGHKSLLAEMTFKHKKTLLCAKASMPQAGNSPQQSVSPLLFLLAFPASKLLQPKRNMGVSFLL